MEREKKKSRASAAERVARVSQVLAWVLEGLRGGEIVARAAETWGIRERQTRKYIASAREQIVARADLENKNALAEHLVWRANLRRKAEQGEDLALALEIAKDEAKLRGLYPKDKTEAITQVMVVMDV